MIPRGGRAADLGWCRLQHFVADISGKLLKYFLSRRSIIDGDAVTEIRQIAQAVTL
jgi:hypothetical protein